MSNPDNPEEFIKNLSTQDLLRLSRLLRTIERVEGWCKINRAIAKFIIYGGIAALIVLSQGIDAIKHLLGFRQ